MLFWLKKILTLPFLPLSFTLICGALGLILCLFPRRARLGQCLLVLAILSLAAFSNKAVSLALLSPLENSFAPIPDFKTRAELPPELARCRAIVVLGGGHSDAPTLSRANQLVPASLSRLSEGIRLAQLLPDARLVTSGHNGFDKISHAQVVAEAAISLGFPASRIDSLHTPRDTEDEAYATKAKFGPGPIALVTSAWHLPRAVALFRGAGIEVVPVPADFLARPDDDTPLKRWLKWDMDSLQRSTRANHEWVGLLWTKLRGKG